MKRAEPLHVIQELTKERQQNIQKNMKTNKRVLGDFSSDIKLLETMLEDKGTVPFQYLMFFGIDSILR